MKSIKEKAKEHSLEPRANSHCGYDEEDLEDSFEAGANYVLDVVECILEDNKLSDCEEICNELIASIEQLKK